MRSPRIGRLIKVIADSGTWIGFFDTKQEFKDQLKEDRHNIVVKIHAAMSITEGATNKLQPQQISWVKQIILANEEITKQYYSLLIEGSEFQGINLFT